MLDLAHATVADFEAVLNDSWTLHDGELSLALVLGSVRSLGAPRPGTERAPFTLGFRATQPVRVPQRVYRLEHPRLGAAEMFLVQTSPTELEAIFN